MRRHLCLGLAPVLTCFLMCFASPAFAYDFRFDVCTMNCTPDGSADHFCTSQLDHLNFVTTNGHVLCQGNDANRALINGAGNFIGAYYNSLTDLYGSTTGNQAADTIENYIVANYTSTGIKTTWVAINEISTSLWPSNSAYRAWLRTAMYRLHAVYGHKIILFSPFPTLLANGDDWVPLSGNCYIAIEKYLSGHDINASGNSVSWCQSQYQASKTSYLNMGIASSQIFLAEHFGQTVAGTTYGRAGVSYAGWENAINARSTAAHNVGFAGFIGYAWGKNGMLVSEADMIHFEDVYAAKQLP